MGDDMPNELNTVRPPTPSSPNWMPDPLFNPDVFDPFSDLPSDITNNPFTNQDSENGSEVGSVHTANSNETSDQPTGDVSIDSEVTVHSQSEMGRPVSPDTLKFIDNLFN
uniref:hypothetical protein n=1 Tax=Fuscoporia viticola TaxID=139386 RepID=UPI0023AA8C11|nr:hypothetical protein P1Q19_mgp17 [Fuscoporia viticola]WCF76842.1 hypothetical protein [Fuscoporia viticola]